MFSRTTLATAIVCGIALGSTQAALANGPHPGNPVRGPQPVHDGGGRIAPNPGGVKQGGRSRPEGAGRNFGMLHGPEPIHTSGGRITPNPGSGRQPGKTPLGGGGMHPSR